MGWTRVVLARRAEACKRKGRGGRREEEGQETRRRSRCSSWLPRLVSQRLASCSARRCMALSKLSLVFSPLPARVPQQVPLILPSCSLVLAVTKRAPFFTQHYSEICNVCRHLVDLAREGRNRSVKKSDLMEEMNAPGKHRRIRGPSISKYLRS